LRRKLSTLEHIISGNIVLFVRLEGSFAPEQFRSALERVQRKHPALRALIREERGRLYYEEDSAPEIPLRVLPRKAEDDYRREAELELNHEFAYDQPQLRAVWLYSELGGDFLLTTSHRICDGGSMLTLMRETLQAVYSDEELVPYRPITIQDIIGNYQPPRLWQRRLAASVINGFIRLIPGSYPPKHNHKFYLEWMADRDLSAALTKRCNAEGVSVHAAFVVLLDRAFLAVCEKKKAPASIHTQMDIRGRRKNFSMLRRGMLFFAGGAVKTQTGQYADMDFWSRARMIHQEMPGQIEQELQQIPGRCHLFEMLRPPTGRQLNTLAWLGQMFKGIGAGNAFMLANMGSVVPSSVDAPFRVTALRPFMHSSKAAVIGLSAYKFRGELYFYYVGDEKQQSRIVAEALKHEFMAALQRLVSDGSHTVEISANQPQADMVEV